MISKNVLTHLPYNKTLKEIDWEHSTLRTWLNSTFYMEAFAKEEREWIARTTSENKDNRVYGTFAGSDTEDRIFLLSSYETEELLQSKMSSDWWWLRTPGEQESYAARVSIAGDIQQRGVMVTENGGVRPAMWVS